LPAVPDDIVFGIDIGGTGIKGAPVDVRSGTLQGERYRVLTPQPSTPANVAATVKSVVEHFSWTGRVGCTFPAVVKDGVVLTAANVDKGWIGTDAEKLFTDALGTDVAVLNDADAAGLAEMRFGAGKGRGGVVLMITLGTGIGCGMFLDGRLVPNTELGHIEIDGKDAEKLAAEIVRERKGLSWKEYAARVQTYLEHIDARGNVVRHTGGTGRLRVWTSSPGIDGPAAVVCEVADGGQAAGPIADPMVGRERPATGRDSGRGLWLANQLCDLVQLRTSGTGTVVRMHVLL
jgi:polyphosphate glucokinase